MIKLYGLKFEGGTDGFVLNVPKMNIIRGEMVALIGPSGCGKTTLLNIVATRLARRNADTVYSFF